MSHHCLKLKKTWQIMCHLSDVCASFVFGDLLQVQVPRKAPAPKIVYLRFYGGRGLLPSLCKLKKKRHEKLLFGKTVYLLISFSFVSVYRPDSQFE